LIVLKECLAYNTRIMMNIIKALSAFENNKEMLVDVTNYAKYLAIKNCPEEKIPDLENIIKFGDFTKLMFFCQDNIINFNEVIK